MVQLKLVGEPFRSPGEFIATSRENEDFVERCPAPKHGFQGVFSDVSGGMSDGLGMKAEKGNTRPDVGGVMSGNVLIQPPLYPGPRGDESDGVTMEALIEGDVAKGLFRHLRDRKIRASQPFA